MGLSHQHSVTLVPPVAWSGVAPRDPQLSHPRTDGLGLLGGQPSGGSRRHPLKPAALEPSATPPGDELCLQRPSTTPGTGQ